MTTAEVAVGPSTLPLPKPAFAAKPATAERELDRALQALREHASEFARTPIATKIGWLREIAQRLGEVSPDLVQAACKAKGIDYDSPLSGEEWLAGPGITLRNIRSADRVAGSGRGERIASRRAEHDP